MKLKLLPLFIAIFIFVIIKINNLGIRLSDTNIYFDVAYQIFQGKLIYRDFFYANFPLFPYISSLYYFILNKNLELFYITSTFEAISVTLIIYYIIQSKTKNILIAFFSSIIYIFSFIVLSTSDHQTGVFTASLFAVISYLFFDKKKFLLSGIFIALSFLTKAYFIPIPTAYFIYLIFQKNPRNVIKFTLGFLLTFFVVLLPFLFFARKEFIYDVFKFSLGRPSGTVKSDVAGFFIGKDLLMFILLSFNIFNFKRNFLFALISIFSICLFLLFQDIYYLYLNFIIPFLCLSFNEFYLFAIEKLRISKIIFLSGIVILISLGVYTYFSNYRDLQKINNLDQIVKIINKVNPDYIFGSDDIVPALLNITKIKPLENVRDAHEYFFDRNILNRNYLTEKALESKTIIIAHGAYYPDLNINERIVDGIFKKDAVLKACRIIGSFPVKTEGLENRINLFKCF